MQTIIVTGSSGLIGSETAKRFAEKGLRIVGIDNDMRAQFFGAEASTKTTRDALVKELREYEHHDLDIRDAKSINALFANIAARFAPSCTPRRNHRMIGPRESRRPISRSTPTAP